MDKIWIVGGLPGSALSLLLMLNGCLSPIALHQAVMEYDRTTAEIQAEMLLLNIARAQNAEPLHFTAVQSVAATFNFSTTAGIAPGGAGLTQTTFAPVFTATVEENPTVTIVPVEGKEFTKRVLTPISQETVSFLEDQEIDANLLGRLLASELIIISENKRRVLHNNPTHHDEYVEFRRRLLHLSSLGLANQLYANRIPYEKNLPFEFPPNQVPSPTEIIGAEEQGYRWRMQEEGGGRVLTKKVKGPLAFTNYPLSDLKNEERRRLSEEARNQPPHTILVDVRPEYPGGNYPIHGYFELRSFLDVLEFVAQVNSTTPEFDVQPDPRTGPIGQNPRLVMKIEQSVEEPEDTIFKVFHRNHWYGIKKDVENSEGGNLWDMVAFTTLNHLYQMTVSDVTESPAPAITIAK